MTHHKPTFQVSPQRRPVYRRLTPLAWALISVALLITCLGLIGGTIAVAERQAVDEPWNPTLTPLASEETLPAPTQTRTIPTPSPTTSPPTVSPIWWSAQMTQDEEGNWWPPQEVQEQVKADFQAFLDEFNAMAAENRFEEIVANLSQWYTGPSLEFQSTALPQYLGENSPGYTEWQNTLFQVQAFSQDGLQCTLGMAAQKYIYYQWIDGELVEQDPKPAGLLLFRMAYDLSDSRWKQYEFLEFHPSSQDSN